VILGVWLGLKLFFVAGKVKIISEGTLIDRMRALSLVRNAGDCVSLIKRVSSIVFGRLEDGCLILTILFVMMQHVLLLFRN
jgi:hypothetical protein